MDDMVKLEAALRDVFVQAIKQVGLANFKATSLFLSNERVQTKKAA